MGQAIKIGFIERRLPYSFGDSVRYKSGAPIKKDITTGTNCICLFFGPIFGMPICQGERKGADGLEEPGNV
jgi:hypothetical protein